MLTESGEFVGGPDALRRVSISLLDGTWHGDVEVHHAYHKNIRCQVDSLLKRPQLTKQEAETLARLRT